MRRPPSALVSIGGFGIAVASISVASTAAIVLLAPEPPVPRTTTAEVLGALHGVGGGFDRETLAHAPDGSRSPMLEQLVAAELRRPTFDVRVTWLDQPSRRQPTKMQAIDALGVPPPRLRESPSIVLVRKGSRRFEIMPPSEASAAIRKTLLALPLSPFRTSVRQPDGRWLSVVPSSAVFGGWQRSVLLALIVSLALIAPMSWVFARKLTRPFRALAGAIEHDDDSMPQDGPRELREAATAISAMRRRLSSEAAERARMLAAIAHDLRTPLTGLRLRVEAAPEPQRARMIADLDRMQAMIGEVLDFARAAMAPAEPFAVRAFVEEIIEDMGLSCLVNLEPGSEMQISAPRLAFRRAVENLVRNAAAYAGSGRVRLWRDVAAFCLEVSDHGPGIPAEDRERLLRPFERGDGSRNRGTGGAGLGLSIVRDFAARCGGALELGTTEGGGLTVRMMLPMSM